jgi:hypothetical protein
LRCFFFAILLRRFFMTEPTRPSLPDALGITWHACARPVPDGRAHANA